MGVLVGLAGAAHAVPTIDCTGLGELVGADAGLISVDDEVVEIARSADAQALPEGREGQRPGVSVVLDPESFCADRGGLVAFILPVPKVSPGEGPVDPDLPEPGVGPAPRSPEGAFGGTGGRGGFDMSPGKAPQAPDLQEESAPGELPDELPPEAEHTAEAEPAPSPSREPESLPAGVVGGAGCAAAPGAPAGLGWLLVALVLLRRKGGAR